MLDEFMNAEARFEDRQAWRYVNHPSAVLSCYELNYFYFGEFDKENKVNCRIYCDYICQSESGNMKEMCDEFARDAQFSQCAFKIGENNPACVEASNPWEYTDNLPRWRTFDDFTITDVFRPRDRIPQS